MLHTGMFCAAMWLNARMGMLSSCFIIQDLLVMTLFSAGLCFVVIFYFFSIPGRALYDDSLEKGIWKLPCCWMCGCKHVFENQFGEMKTGNKSILNKTNQSLDNNIHI